MDWYWMNDSLGSAPGKNNWVVIVAKSMFISIGTNAYSAPCRLFPSIGLWEAFCEIFCEGPLTCHGFSKSLSRICDVSYPVLGAAGLCNGDGSGDSKRHRLWSLSSRSFQFRWFGHMKVHIKIRIMLPSGMNPNTIEQQRWWVLPEARAEGTGFLLCHLLYVLKTSTYLSKTLCPSL